MPVSCGTYEKLQKASQDDQTIAAAIKHTISGWPGYAKDVNKDLLDLYSVRGHLSVADSLLLYETRIVIPDSMRPIMLKSVHEGHWGVKKCRERAAQLFWWPGFTRDLTKFIANCDHCNQQARYNRREPMVITETPSTKWEVISTDLFFHQSKNYMVVFDEHSKYLEIVQLASTTSVAVINKLMGIFSRWGFPRVIKSDNGPQYVSDEFISFAKLYGITQITSSPRYPQSNGAAERAVALAKKILGSEDPNLAILAYRSSKTSTGYTPNEIMLGRQVRTNLPTRDSALRDVKPSDSDIKLANQQTKWVAKQIYDKSATPLPELQPGTPVRLRREGEWSKNKYYVVRKASTPRSYILNDPETGRDLRRNRRQLLPTPINNDNDPNRDEPTRDNHNDTEQSQPSTDDNDQRSSSLVTNPSDGPRSRPIRNCGPPSRYRDFYMGDP
jgi:transposase InsO family protein